jgi:hypothetical protein
VDKQQTKTKTKTKQKHEKFDKSDELVGLIYDGAYSCLRNGDDEEGQPSVDEL